MEGTIKAIKDFGVSNKVTLIRVAGSVVGAVVGVFVAAALTSEPYEEVMLQEPATEPQAD